MNLHTKMVEYIGSGLLYYLEQFGMKELDREG